MFSAWIDSRTQGRGSIGRWGLALGLLPFLLGPVGCGKTTAPRPTAATAPASPLAVANTYLESAVLDLLGDQTKLVRLAKPCFCPGHYDLETNMVAAVRASELFLRFDSESALDQQIKPGPQDPVKIHGIAVPAGTLTLDQYRDLCRQVAAALVGAGRLEPAQAQTRQEELARLLRRQADTVRQRLVDAGLFQAPVLAAAGQEKFCEWLGLKVVAVFGAEENAAAVSDLVARARQAGVRFVVTDYSATRPMADELARQLGINPIRLAGVPPLLDQRPSYGELLQVSAQAFVPTRKPAAP